MGFCHSSAGCPRAGRALFFGRMSACRRLVLRLALLSAGTIWLSAAHPEQANRVVRARFEWKSEKPERWAGVLETSQGTIANPASLDESANEAGTLWADGKCLWLGRRNACSRDGFEVTVIAR